MKIVLIGLTYPFRGGISHYTTLLFRELQRGHSVNLIALRKQFPDLLFPGKTQHDESDERIEVENEPVLHPLHPWTWYSALLKIREISPELTLFQWWHPYFAPCFGTLALLLKRWTGGRICFLCHNVRPHEATLLDTLLLKYAFIAPDRFIVHSEEDRRNLLSLKPGATVMKTPHPVYDVFKSKTTGGQSEAKRKLGIDGDMLLFFGYVRRYKGLDYLIEAFPKVVREAPCTLLIAGEIYQDREKVLRMIEESPAKDHIRLMDEYVPNERVGLYFEAADLVVLPYVSATQSGIIQIAYGFNRPVVSTKVGGLPEVVDEGRTGFLAEPKDADDLARCILRFFSERERIDFSGNIEKARERFSWKRLVEVVERIYEGDA
jgi:glycosyltransferase involved in cell wall biosynthesis